MIYKEAFPSCSQTKLGCAATSETAAKCERGREAQRRAEQSWWGKRTNRGRELLLEDFCQRERTDGETPDRERLLQVQYLSLPY